MTIPAKENLIYFEDLEKKQTRLWDDACDIGIDLTGRAGVKTAARENLLALMATYAYKMDRGILSSLTEIFIPFEFDADAGKYIGVNLTVSYTYIKKREILIINIDAASKTHTAANANGNLFKTTGKPVDFSYLMEYTDDRDADEGAYLAEQGRSNPNVWAEAAYDAKRFA
jgi:hypothetical protein